MPVSATRKFSGKVWRFYTDYKTKGHAEKAATVLRKYGHQTLIRNIPIKGGFPHRLYYR